MKVKLNSYNVLLTIRRLIGISILLILGYWIVHFGIKSIFYIMYAGTRFIDRFFKYLVM